MKAPPDSTNSSAVYFYRGPNDRDGMDELESKIRRTLPQLKRVDALAELIRDLSKRSSDAGDKAYLLFPTFEPVKEAVDRIIALATEHLGAMFFVLVSPEITASDYKRLVRTGAADWVSIDGAPHEIRDILMRHRSRSSENPAEKPAIAVFVPSSGGVGNATITIESGARIATKDKSRRVCLIDLDFQSSHTCDYLDIEPRLKIDELSSAPDRLDEQLFELSLSHHSSGLDILAAPRNKIDLDAIDINVLDGLFEMASKRYDLILVDLPCHWFSWTSQILSAADIAIVTGVNTIPSLRQIAETVKAVQGVDMPPQRLVAVVNRCRPRIMGGISGRQHANQILGREDIFFVREDSDAARQSLNAGVPMMLQSRFSKVSKDIASIAEVLRSLKPALRAVAQ